MHWERRPGVLMGGRSRSQLVSHLIKWRTILHGCSYMGVAAASLACWKLETSAVTHLANSASDMTQEQRAVVHSSATACKQSLQQAFLDHSCRQLRCSALYKARQQARQMTAEALTLNSRCLTVDPKPASRACREYKLQPQAMFGVWSSSCQL